MRTYDDRRARERERVSSYNPEGGERAENDGNLKQEMGEARRINKTCPILRTRQGIDFAFLHRVDARARRGGIEGRAGGLRVRNREWVEVRSGLRTNYLNTTLVILFYFLIL